MPSETVGEGGNFTQATRETHTFPREKNGSNPRGEELLPGGFPRPRKALKNPVARSTPEPSKLRRRGTCAKYVQGEKIAMPTFESLGRTEPAAYPRHMAISASQARNLDLFATTKHGIPSLVLMEHASRGVATVLSRVLPDEGAVLVLCGPGNNGGDGHGIARFLASWGYRVVRCEIAPPKGLSADAERERQLANDVTPIASAASREDLQTLLQEEAPDWVVDAWFGVGLDRPLRAPYPDLIRALNACPIPVLAVDLPSGLDADTGRVLPVAVKADLTATMAAPKLGLLAGEGPAHAGHVIEIDIGLPRALHMPFAEAAAPKG